MIDRNDTIVISCVILKLGTIFLTAILMTLGSSMTGAKIESVVQLMELNVFINMFVKLNQMSAVFMILLGPGLMFGVYVVMKKYATEKPWVIDFYVTFMLFTTVGDFLNDLGVVLGQFIRLGLV